MGLQGCFQSYNNSISNPGWTLVAIDVEKMLNEDQEELQAREKKIYKAMKNCHNKMKDIL